MFLHWLYPLVKYSIFFNLFRYITFRSAGAAITALGISFFLGPWIIRKLELRGIRERVRSDGPRRHLTKEGTPTMGGLIILASVVLPTVLWADVCNRYVLLTLLATVWMGAVGFLDDYLKVVKEVPKGLVGRYKLVGQIVLGIVIATFLYLRPFDPRWATATSLPFFKGWALDLGLLYLVMVVFVISGTSNAVNLTDGLDGLAIGLVGIVAAALGLVAYVTGRADFSAYLGIPYIRGAGELTVYCTALVGASLGFLWFNAYPARVFMGDTGALSLGAALGTLSVLLKVELLLPVIGGVFVAEVASVVLQRYYFKYTRKRTGEGRRIFRMAPLHHHFELLGWSEPKIVVRFWIVGILLALLGLSTFKVR